MISMDEILHRAYNSVEQEDGSWIYIEEKFKKPISKKSKTKKGKRILDKKRGRLKNDLQKELY